MLVFLSSFEDGLAALDERAHAFGGVLAPHHLGQSPEHRPDRGGLTFRHAET